MMAENTHVDVKRLSFERAIEELETIVRRLEEGKVPLEESVTIYERGEALEAALRGIAAAGRSPRRQDHHRFRGPGQREPSRSTCNKRLLRLCSPCMIVAERSPCPNARCDLTHIPSAQVGVS